MLIVKISLIFSLLTLSIKSFDVVASYLESQGVADMISGPDIPLAKS